MLKIISPQNKIIVQIEKKFQDTISFASGVTLYQDTTFHPEQHAMLKAKVISVPRSILQRADYDGYNELPSPGDTILMRYDVVYSYRNQPDRDTPIYKNILHVRGEEYWLADILQVFAVETQEGYRMLNGYVFCDLLAEKREAPEWLTLPMYMTAEVRNDKMRVRHINHPTVTPGDTIYCTPNVAQRYSINMDSFYIIKQSHIQGIAV